MSAVGVMAVCPDCKRGALHRQGPLEWCPLCAYETPESRSVPDVIAQRFAPKNEREEKPAPEMPFEERVLRWIAERVETGKPVSVERVAIRFTITSSEAQEFMAGDWCAYLNRESDVSEKPADDLAGGRDA